MAVLRVHHRLVHHRMQFSTETPTQAYEQEIKGEAQQAGSQVLMNIKA